MTAPKSPTRPGISRKTLLAAGIRFGDTPEMGSIEIPYYDLRGNQIGFSRWRLPRERADGQKYYQETGTGTRAYIPPQFLNFAPGGDLVIVEGEFKCLCLIEAEIKAIGLPSFNTYTRDDKGEPQLLSGIVEVIAYTKPERILFLGDSDTATNCAFARNALILAKMVNPLPVSLPRIPIGGTGKGIDDCRENIGSKKFAKLWVNCVADAESIDIKGDFASLAVRLLEREASGIKKLAGSEFDKALRRVAAMGAKIIDKPLPFDRLVGIVEKSFGISRGAFKKAVADAKAESLAEIDGRAENQNDCPAIVNPTAASEAGDSLQKEELSPFQPAKPWALTVDGPTLLDAIEAYIRRFVVIDSHALTACVLWLVFTHAVDVFEYAPILRIFSATKRCGKSLLKRVLTPVVARPLATSNISPPALFRVIQDRKPTVMIDELDSLPDGDQKQTITNLLNAGFCKHDSTVIRCDGDNNDVREFNVFGPKFVAAIGELGDTVEDRSIRIIMRRKLSAEKVERIRDRHVDPTLASRAAKWATDNNDLLLSASPSIPSRLNDRQADIWEPLLAIADVCGGNWPERARSAAVALCVGEAEADGGNISVTLLRDIKLVFDADPTKTKVSSQELCSKLGEIEESPWSCFAKNGEINPNHLSRLLKPFSIFSDSVRIGGKTPKGYHRDQFEEHWKSYLPENPPQSRNTATSSVNIENNALLEPQLPPACCGIQNTVPVNSDLPSCVVAPSKQENAPDDGKNTMLL